MDGGIGNQRDHGLIFDEVPELYDRVRPDYPNELFEDLAAITGIAENSKVLEVGCGTGLATRSFAARGYDITAVEPGAGMAAVAARHLTGQPNVRIEQSTFEAWEDRGRRFDLVTAASAWHWVDPSIGWQKAHDVLRPGGWLAILGNVVYRLPDEPEVYAETADLHELYSPGNAWWAAPPLEAELRATGDGWGFQTDPGDLFDPPVAHWFPFVQWFDGEGFADLLRSMSIYRRLDPTVREPLLDGITERIRTRMDDRAPRRYLSVIRAGRRRLEP